MTFQKLGGLLMKLYCSYAIISQKKLTSVILGYKDLKKHLLMKVNIKKISVNTSTDN